MWTGYGPCVVSSGRSRKASTTWMGASSSGILAAWRSGMCSRMSYSMNERPASLPGSAGYSTSTVMLRDVITTVRRPTAHGPRAAGSAGFGRRFWSLHAAYADGNARKKRRKMREK